MFFENGSTGFQSPGRGGGDSRLRPPAVQLNSIFSANTDPRENPDYIITDVSYYNIVGYVTNYIVKLQRDRSTLGA